MTAKHAGQNRPLWKDLIHIPEDRETFVLNLNAGLDRQEQTVEQYVVTESLKERFEQALSMLADGLAVGRPGKPESNGAFLHGSFGSGKSHFMAILNLMLGGFGPARDLDRLRDVVVEHPWMDDLELLMIPFHMLGSKSMEAAVLGGYVEYIRKEHPEASIPGVYVSEKVLGNAEDLRATMEESNFFNTLNGTSGDDAGWGSYGGTAWDRESYMKALKAPEGDDARTRLIGDLVDTLLPAVHDTAKAAEGGLGFVGFDEGLSIISRHAKTLGYDGLLLFLDELILWLARRSAQPELVSNEVQKISKFVEYEHTDRPVPIFSFIARQRDLSEMIGDDYSGEASQQLALHQESLKGRFQVIELEDRNLPDIAHARLLQPRDKEASILVEEAFESKMKELTVAERDIMATSQHDRDSFRKVFPFSPALVETLVVLSNELQRKRTALQIMQLLLMRKRESLALGELIAVGDLWEVLREGQEPFDAVKRRLFRAAKDIDTYKIRPVIGRHHGVDDVGDLEPDDPKDARILSKYSDDLRLLHSLLIGALVPHLEVFENMTPQKLVALNHGTVKSPIPGAEADQVLPKLRKWATDIGELHLSDAPNQTVELRLEGIDVEPLIEQANAQDRPGTRVQWLKKSLYQWIGIEEGRDLRAPYKLEWRGDKRRLDIAFANIREEPFSRLKSDGEHWLLIIDYPFDTGGHGAKDDIKQKEAFLKAHPEGSETLLWLPKFLSSQGQKLLGKLIKIEAVLNQFDAYAGDLRNDDRGIAKRQLESNRDGIKNRLQLAFENVYGLGTGEPELVADEADMKALHTLEPEFDPGEPGVGKTFADALEGIARRALKHKYPKAPMLPDKKLRRREVVAMQEVIRRAIDSAEKSVHVEERKVRKNLRAYAEPIKLGVMGDNRFEVKREWANTVDQKLQPGGASVQVGDIYELIDPESRDEGGTGIARELKDLIVLSVADMENFVVRRGDRSIDLGPGELKSTDLLEQRRMPDEDAFEAACAAARDIFDQRPPQTLGARNVQHLAGALRKAGDAHRVEAMQLTEELVMAGHNMSMSRVEVERTRRYQVADLMRRLMSALDERDDTDLIEAVEELGLDDDRKAVSRSLSRVGENLEDLENIRWYVFGKQFCEGREVSAGAQTLLERAQHILSSPEHSVPLKKLKNVEKDLLDLLVEKSNKGGDAKEGSDGSESAADSRRAELAGSAGELPELLKQWIGENVEGEQTVKVIVMVEE